MHRFKAIHLLILMAVLVTFGCATLPENFERPVSHAYTDTENTILGRSRRHEMEAHPGESGFLLLENGRDAFVARAVLTRLAERSIDVQYYLYHDDLVGLLLMDQLIQAADRGVRVRILVDDMDLAGRDLSAAMLDSHPNMALRIFNPFARQTSRGLQYLTRFGSVTRRMHNKSFTVDNQVTILGGRNIGNEYFEADPDLAFSDLDAAIIGPVVDEVSTAFDRYWNSDLAYPASVLNRQPTSPEEMARGRRQLTEFVAKQADSAYLNALRNSDLADRLRKPGALQYHWGRAEVVYDQPEKLLEDRGRTEYHLAPKLKPFFKSVREELIIFSPYFVPGKAGTEALCQLSRRGVRVRILTNSLASNDVGIVHAGYARYRKALLRGGVELYELDKKLTLEQRSGQKGASGSSKASLHAKSFVIDRTRVFIGSLNLDPRSVVENTEIGVILTSPEVAGEMGAWFDEKVAIRSFRLTLEKGRSGAEKILWHGRHDGKPAVYDADPYTGFWRRLGISLLGLLPIESQL